MAVAVALDPRLCQGAYISAEGGLFYVLRPAGTESIMIEDCLTMEARAVPIPRVLAEAELVRAADPLASPKAA